MYNVLARFAMNTGVRETIKENIGLEKTRRVFTVENCEKTGRIISFNFFLSLSLLANGFETLAFFISLNCVKFASSRLTYT